MIHYYGVPTWRAKKGATFDNMESMMTDTIPTTMGVLPVKTDSTKYYVPYCRCPTDVCGVQDGAPTNEEEDSEAYTVYHGLVLLI